VKRSSLFLLDASYLFLVAVGFLAAVFASCGLILMFIVRCKEGALQATDWRVVTVSAKWLLASVVVTGGIWWLRCRTIPIEARGNSLRLTASKSRHGEEVGQLFFGIVLCAIFAWLVWGIARGSPATKVVTVVVTLAVALLLMHVRIFIHELGHLFVAWMLRFELHKIQVGTGPSLCSFLFKKGLLFEWHLSPKAGFVIAFPQADKNLRLLQLMFVVAGPLADLLVILTGYKLITGLYGSLGAAFDQGTAGFGAVVLFWWTVFSAVSGFIPHKVRIGGHDIWTDGYWILRLCFTPTKHKTEWALYFGRKRALELLRSENAPSNSLPKAQSRNSLTTFQQQRARLASLTMGRGNSSSPTQ
jgi:Peptidase family M50